ncbi:hypothetical protein [uncultured Pseudokineococcus sp.]|uniref:hypothetical protein n=1 Tax=uncultured Pseudokineococcus sp. TaxID=1642928 RepID=UPI002626A022|nr:hypothetical protein [uncultured Pseudokineococcus sp.]
MSRIRMRVHLHNDSDAALELVDQGMSSGQFTPGGHPPPRIEPGQRPRISSEGKLLATAPATGAQGHVTYRITGTGPVGEVHVGWNSPLVESDYGNTFTVTAPEGWEVSHWGGQGHEGRLEVRLRRSAVRLVPGFHPRGRGLPFDNGGWRAGLPSMTLGHVWNQLLDSLPDPLGDVLGIVPVDDDWLPLTHAEDGMCGGMVFTVMDLFHHHLVPDPSTRQPVSADDPLYAHLRQRLWDSFDVGGRGHRWLAYSSPHYPNGDDGVLQDVLGLARGRSWVSYREAWPDMQADIDAGRPSPVGLIRTASLEIQHNHTVLAYGYRRSGQTVTLHVYDPSAHLPDRGNPEVQLHFDVTSTGGEVHVRRTVDGVREDGRHRIWAFLRIDGYEPVRPPLGRRITSLVDAVRATTAGRPGPDSVREAMAATGGGASTTAWVRSL